MKPRKKQLHWEFPLPRTHTGIVLGNGLQGVMVWGGRGARLPSPQAGNWANRWTSNLGPGDAVPLAGEPNDAPLCLTVARAGFWDHRSGRGFNSEATYAKVRQLLEAHDEEGLRRLFPREQPEPGQPPRPQQLGGGRIELRFPDGLVPTEAILDLRAATLSVELRNDAGRRELLTLRQAIRQELLWVEVPAKLAGQLSVRVVPAWDHLEERMKAIGIAPPERLAWQHEGRPGGGFVQTLPKDPELALAWQNRGDVIAIATAVGADFAMALDDGPEIPLGRGAAARARDLATDADLEHAGRRTKAWWRKYWQDVPDVALPDPVLQRVHDYGLFKQAGLTPPHGVAAALQGPWMEEYQFPPWSNDYHFNINVQMVYWPTLATNRLEHLKPLWEMLKQWFPVLHRNGRQFFGQDGALLLPHAVDDRCQVIGSFWTGTIDHACTAWMAQLAWLHYRYSMDRRVLEEMAWPLLVGAFEGYWAMCEEIAAPGGGKRLSLPASVSPEYNGAGMNAWGQDASFQLAAAHCTARTLQQAAAVLGRAPDPRWQRLRNELPLYTPAPKWTTQSGAPPGEEARPDPRIGLWEGKDLETSHRHHSHLGAIYPFRTLDPLSAQHSDLARNSMGCYTKAGMGAWSGWSFPWAAILWARCNDSDNSVALLHWWDEAFCNEGGGTRHDALFPGPSRICAMPPCSAERPAEKEIMQCDAAMGAVAAIGELLVQCRGEAGERIVVLPRVPLRWRQLSFDGIRTEGAFLVGATVEEGRVTEVRAQSLAGGRLCLEHQLGEQWTLDGQPGSGPVAEVETQPGQRLVFRRMAAG